MPVCLVIGTSTALAQPRVWIAEQNNNAIYEIHPTNHDPAGPAGSDVQLLKTLPSPALAFLDELTFDDQERLWCVVKQDGDQDPDGCRRIDKETGAVDVPPDIIFPDFPGEAFGGYLEGLAWDGVGLWVTAVRNGQTGNMLTRVSPVDGSAIAPFDSGTLGAAGFVNIPGTVAQGLLWEPGNGGYGWLWHSEVFEQKLYKLDVALLFDGDDGNDNSLVVAEFSVPFKPKGMDWMEDKIWIAAPATGPWNPPGVAGIYAFDPGTGTTQKLFSTPQWSLDGIAILPEPPGPEIELSTSAINRSVWIGDALADDAFTVANGGDDTLNYDIGDDAGWMAVEPDSGSSTGPANSHGVSFGVAGFAAGVYTATITVTGNAYNSPQLIAVTVTVETVGPDLDGDADVDQKDYGMFQRCYSGPGGGITIPGCSAADFDGDSDVDANDFSIFQACHTADHVPAQPGCDDP